MKIIAHANIPVSNPSVWKASVAAKYNNVNLEVDTAFNTRSKEFNEINPFGKVPVLVTEEGPIFESNAISRYVADINDSGKLFGNNKFERGLVNQWIDWSQNEIDLPGNAWVLPVFGYADDNEQATEQAKKDLKKNLVVLNRVLASRTFLVGERVTLADIVVALSLYNLFAKILDSKFRKPLNHVVRWYKTVLNQPNVKAVVTDFTLCDKAEVAQKKTEDAAAPKGDDKKETAPAAAAPAPKKKEKNPLDLLPPTSFSLDDWKRTYSNEETREVALPYFWKNYDAEGWSLWFAEFKYNEDNTKLFQTCNLVGGYIQRLESLRKYGFGNIIIFGKEPELEIAACWLVRGKEIPEELSGCPDSELYTFTRVDINDEAQKELVNDFFAWDGDFKGRKSNEVAEGKTFK